MPSPSMTDDLDPFRHAHATLGSESPWADFAAGHGLALYVPVFPYRRFMIDFSRCFRTQDVGTVLFAITLPTLRSLLREPSTIM